MGLCLTATLIAATSLATLFEDIRGRFTVDLPQGWVFAPQPGEVSGASFQRVLNGVLARFAVQVIPVGPTTTLDAFVGGVSASVMREPGYALKTEDHGRLAGLSTLRRRYAVTAKGFPRDTKLVEDWFAVQDGKGYVVHMESSVDGFAALEPDFDYLRVSLRFADVDPMAPPPHPPTLIGRWAMVGAEATVFRLDADGTFDLDGTPGVWRAKGDDLMTRPLGGGAELFEWRLVGDELELSGASLDQPIRYRRVTGSEPALTPVPRPSLEGKWIGKGQVLEIGAGGALVLNGEAGTFVEADGMLVMRVGKKGQRVVAEFKLEGNRLTLSRDRFGKGVVLERQ